MSQHSPPLQDLLTPPMVASLLGLPCAAVYAAFDQPDEPLAHIRTPGGQIRVRRRDVLAYCHRDGFVVPAGLLPERRVVVVHPEPSRGRKVVELLEELALTSLLDSPIDGLLDVGQRRPHMVVLAIHGLMDSQKAQQLTEGIRRSAWLGYVCVVHLTSGRETTWTEGRVPDVVRLGESSPVAASVLRGLLGASLP